MAAEDGLELRFELNRGGNTFDAHRLTHLAAAHDLARRDGRAPVPRATTPRAC